MDLGAPSPTPPRHDNRADNSDASLLGQDTAYHERKSARHRRRAGVLSWRSRHGSIYLHRISLIGMALLFICFFVLIEVLNNFSSRDQGFVDTQESSHYLWRFGPTLVLSLVAALWGQVEYQVESAMPWVELRRQPLPAEKNLLLNYRSPWSITSLFRSLKAGHFAVGVAIFGGFVLKALIVVSTGLFAAEGRSVTQSAEFQVVDRFNFSLHRNSLVENVVANIDPGVAFWAINTGNVPPPAGVNPEFATVSFSTRAAADLPPDATLTANTTTLGVEMDCKTFSWNYETRGKRSANFSVIDQDLFSLADIVPPADVDVLSPFFVQIGSQRLDSTHSLTGNDSSRWLNQTVFVDTFYDPTFFSPLFGEPDETSRDIDTGRIFSSVVVDLPNKRSQVTAVLCHPIYSLTKRRVTTKVGDEKGGSILDVSSEVLDKLELGIAPSIITSDTVLSTRSITNNFFPRSDLGRLVDNEWIPIMNMTMPQPGWTAFENKDVLSATLRKSFRDLVFLNAKLIRAAPANADQRLPGVIVRPVTRLVITTAVLRAMEALFIIMALSAATIAFYNFGSSMDHSGTLFDTAEVLSRSDALAPLLTNSARGCDSEKMRGYLFSSSRDPTVIHVQHDLRHDTTVFPTKKEEASGISKPLPFYLPTAMTKVYRISTVVITLVFFIVIETLFEVSKKNGGLADVPAEGYTQYVWTFLPTFAMASLGLAYVAMDKGTRMLHPYLQMTRHGGSDMDALKFDPQSSVALVALLRTLRRRAPGLSLIIVTSILGGILAICSTGLYTTVSAQPPRSVSVDTATWFDIRRASLLWDGYYAARSPLKDGLFGQAIELMNLPYPAGTYKEFAFAMPDLARVQDAVSGNNLTGRFTARVPAARYQSNCELQEFIKLDKGSIRRDQIEYTITPPIGCSKDDKLPDRFSIANNMLDLSQQMMSTPKPGPFGFLAQTVWGRGNLRLPHTVCADNTQHLFFVWGTVAANNETHNVTVIHCKPSLEAVNVEATFLLPSLQVDDSPSTPPPRVVDNANSTRKWTAFNETSIPLPLPGLLVSPADSNFDSYFSYLTRGVHFADLKPPIAELIASARDTGKDTESDAGLGEMIRRINALSQELAAQSLHLNLRKSVADAVDPDQPAPRPITGAVVLEQPAGRARLVQNEVATRLLEGLLIALVVCAVVSFWLVGWRDRTIRVLPEDPGSVAAVMALFEGSELVGQLRGDGDFASYEERFGLRWWEREREKKYGIDVM